MPSDIPKIDYFDDNMPYVFMGVLRRAIADYKLALKKKRERAIRKLEKFFYSEYCEKILALIEFDQDLFYEKLGRLVKQYA